jgi:hypothetical protein
MTDLISEETITRLGSIPNMLTEFAPATVLRIVSMLQLAARHPALPDEHRAVVASVANAARDYFRDFPDILIMIDAGDDPANDR